MSRHRTETPARIIRCAIYTRKSTEEGLDQEFNSLDAQRESGEAFIASQQHEGWTCLPEHYDDGGFTGGNMDRPGLKRLMADIEAKQIDCVVVYKVDRLSRSLMDFSRMMELFDRKGVSFVSVTQQFNTTHSMGRLTLNILLSFAQFEREIISERTRDKIAATRRKGRWSGGRPILGYDVERDAHKLVVNAAEASRVRQIFELYLDRQGLVATIAELERRDWRTKRWTTRKGTVAGGRPFDKANLYGLLKNVIYIGKVRYKKEIHPGQHEAIVDGGVFEKVGALLTQNRWTGGPEGRAKFSGLLRGLVRCVPCASMMVPAHTTRNGQTRYRYYTCLNAQKRGWSGCPSKSIPAGELEHFVIDQVRSIVKDPGLVGETVAQARALSESRIAELGQERLGLERDQAHYHAEMRSMVVGIGQATDRLAARLADLQERIQSAENRTVAIQDETDGLRNQMIDEQSLNQTLADFDPVWALLTLQEQARLLHLLIERIEYDGRSSDIAITFHPTGIATLANELTAKQENAA